MKKYQVKNGEAIIESALNWEDAMLTALEDTNYMVSEMSCSVYNSKVEHPTDCVYIGRGSPFGNPFPIGTCGNRDEVCDLYEEFVMQDKALLRKIKKELKGKNLLCYCKPLRCHGDFLLKLANE